MPPVSRPRFFDRFIPRTFSPAVIGALFALAVVLVVCLYAGDYLVESARRPGAAPPTSPAPPPIVDEKPPDQQEEEPELRDLKRRMRENGQQPARG